MNMNINNIPEMAEAEVNARFNDEKVELEARIYLYEVLVRTKLDCIYEIERYESGEPSWLYTERECEVRKEVVAMVNDLLKRV